MKFARLLLALVSLAILITGPVLAAPPSQTESTDSLLAFQRLTPDTGWVLMGRRLYWTEDRGQSWRERAAPDLGQSLVLAGTFADAQHGWVLTSDVADSGEPRYRLARTTDGAQSWQTLHLPLFEPGDVRALAAAAQLQFLDPHTGWLLVQQQTSSAFSVGTLFKTRDGGATWTRLPPLPIAGAFQFVDDQTGWVEDRGVRYQTQDGGKTWSGSGDVKGEAAPIAPAITGWKKSVTGECDGSTCWQTTELLQTDDGGQTWQPVPLPHAPEGVTTVLALNGVVSQDPGALRLTFDGQGFDSCTKPPVSDMQNWYDNSPYKVWNLYLGGISLFGPCTGLTASYVSQLAQQGWTFIPTWVGPQAACSTYGHRMSADPAVAYVEGKVQADLAMDVATQLGLTFSDQAGSIIYYDIEVYTGASQACRDATKAFISGWVERLHASGNDAGVYGSPCSSYIYDFAGFVDPPDDAWLAVWSYSSYTSTASVFNLPCVNNNLWRNAQRLRQYAGDHAETWGGDTINIDSDVLSGTVATVLGNCVPNANQVALYVYAQDGGQCVVRGIGTYPDPASLGLPNDSISALRVGSNVTVTLFQHTFYNGLLEDFSDDDNDLSNNPIGDNQVSSARVQTYTTPVVPRFLYLPALVRYPPYAAPVPNGDFESGRSVWAESSALTQTLIVTASVLPTGTTPHSGNWLAWLGNLDDETASIEQTLIVPASAPYLSYWLSIVSDETGCFYDYASVLVNDVPMDTFALCTDTDTNGWAYRALDLTPYANQAVTVTFSVVTDSSVTSHLFIDDVAFQVGP